MAKTKGPEWRDDNIRKVTNALMVQQHTMRELETLTKINYYSIRLLILDLVDKGLVRERGFRGKSRVYSLVNPQSDGVNANNAIPRAKGPTGLPLKVSTVLNFVGSEKTMTSFHATKDLPMLVARLLWCGWRQTKLNNTEETQADLDLLKIEMENNAKALRTTLNIYETILKDHIVWNAERIALLPRDVDFNEQQVMSAYKHYFPDS